MFYVVALGNPGDEYQNTRHNIGWVVLDGVRAQLAGSELTRSKNPPARLGSGMIAGTPVQYIYPETYMNQSGQVVRVVVPKTELDHLVVLHDDVALSCGEVRISFGRGSGGQNGVQSIIDAMGSKDFVRVRLGISPRSFWTGHVKRPTGAKLASYVLARLTKKEQQQVDEVVVTVTKALETIVQEGYVSAMNKFN